VSIRPLQGHRFCRRYLTAPVCIMSSEACLLFVRLSSGIAMTGAFRLVKYTPVRDGPNPSVETDAVWYYTVMADTFVPFGTLRAQVNDDESMRLSTAIFIAPAASAGNATRSPSLIPIACNDRNSMFAAKRAARKQAAAMSLLRS